MRTARHLPNRLAHASSIAPRPLTHWQRAGRTCCVLAVLCGQIGLPNLSPDFTSAAKDAKLDATTDAGCQCPPALRRVGRCCCAAKLSFAATSCCAKKKSCRKAVEQEKQAKKTEVAFGNSCPCDQHGDVDGYRCDDPRVMPKAPPALKVAARTISPVWTDSHACGELLPPPVPPPEFPLV